MLKILFVCHGNICRSPMAEYLMKALISQEGLSRQVEIASAATSTEELGNPVYPPARKILAAHGISCAGHAERQITPRDFASYDLILGMDEANLRTLRRTSGNEYQGKLHKLLEFAGRDGDVADPWYTRDFAQTWQDISAGCQGLIQYIRESRESK